MRLGGSVIGHVGELSPEPAGSSTSRAGLPSARSSLIPPGSGRSVATSPSAFPHVDFDLSFLLPSDLAVGRLIGATSEAGADLVESARVFDVFRGPASMRAAGRWQFGTDFARETTRSPTKKCHRSVRA